MKATTKKRGRPAKKPLEQYSVEDLKSAFQTGIMEALPIISSIATGKVRRVLTKVDRFGEAHDYEAGPEYAEQIAAFNALCTFGLQAHKVIQEAGDGSSSEVIKYEF